MLHPLLAKMEQTAMEEQLWGKGETIVVAVSGGPDSMALLHMLHRLSSKWELQIIAAHLNHRFRGAEAEAEAETVRGFAERLGCPFAYESIDVPYYIEETGMNAQAAARQIRYRFLMRTAEQYGAGVIALAHHADDQAETVLMRIIHGAGPAGLAGMPVRREAGRLKLIRPLLRIYKSDIIAYCNEHHIRFCTDSSNQQRKYERNRIRLDAIPFLERYNPKLSSSLNRLADVIRGEDDYMSLETERLFRSSVRPAGNGYQFVREPFLNVHVALQRRLIKLILSYLISEPETVDFAKVEMIRKAILNGHPTTLRYDLDEGVRFVREYESIRLIRCEDGGSSGYEYRIDRDTRTIRIGETGATLHLQVIPPDSVHRWSEDPYEAYFDLDVLRFPLRLRTRRPGDRIEPIGMNGTKKVKDLLIDRKIPPSERDRLALVVDADNSVLWIPGIRRSSRALVRNGTANVLHMKLKPQRAARLNHE